MNSGPVEIMPPLPIYNLTLEDLARDEGLAAVQNQGYFLYRIKSDGVVVRQAQVALENGTIRFDSFGESSGFLWIGNALDELAKLDQLKAASYEARLLRGGLPIRLEILAIWLKPDAGDGDLLYWISHATRTPFEYGKLYTAKEFFAALRQPARDLLSLPTAPVIWTTEDEMHAYFVNRFVAEPGRGESRMPAPSLQPDDLMQLAISDPASGDGKSPQSQTYRLNSVELIGMAFHNPAVLYSQSHHNSYLMPAEMAKNLPATSRLLTDSEKKMLADLVTNKKEVVAQTDHGERTVFGVIRARPSCLECHTTAKTGDPLGAFSYHLVPQIAWAKTAHAGAPTP